MKFVFYLSLNDEARRAIDSGDGKHGQFAVDGDCIATIDERGRAQDWIRVIRSATGAPIEAITD